MESWHCLFCLRNTRQLVTSLPSLLSSSGIPSCGACALFENQSLCRLEDSLTEISG